MTESPPQTPESPPEQDEDPLERLTAKQRLFVHYYCGSAAGNGTRAARLAGYEGNANTLSSMAWENLRKPDIKAAIEAELDRLAMDEREILWRMSQHARVDMGDFLNAQAPGRVFVDLSAGEEGDKPLHLIRKIKQRTLARSGVGDDEVEVLLTEIEVVDAQAALRDLARIKGLMRDRVELTGKDGKDLKLGVGVDFSGLTDEQIDLVEEALEALASAGSGQG